jgi:proteasome lid subunit RPN8/RPN11
MIRIPLYIINDIVAQARKELPNEACGLLTGKDNEAIKQYPLTNIDHSCTLALMVYFVRDYSLFCDLF